MKSYVRAHYRRAVAAAASLTGKRFGLLVASSLVATSAIVAAAMTSPSGVSPLAALVGQSLAANQTPTEAAPIAPPGPATGSAGASAGPASAKAQAGGPLPSPAPVSSPEASAPAQPAPAEEPAPAPTAPAETLPEAGPIKHVFVISLTSRGYEATFGTASQMPYLSTELRPQGELLSGYSLLDDSALPNEMAAIGGQAPNAKTKAGCPQFDDCVLPVETTSIADQLAAGRFTWRAYMEGMTDPATAEPGNCVYPGAEEPYPPAAGGYSATRNPFVYFHSLLDLGDCAADDLPLTSLEAALRKADATANLSYVAPSLCNSGSTVECPEGQAGGPAAADAFLAAWVPKILASPAYRKDGLLIVTFGSLEPAPTSPGVPAAPTPSRKVGTLMVSQFLSPGATDAKPYDPYSLLRSTEDMFGLSHLGAANGRKVKPFASTTLLREGTGD